MMDGRGEVGDLMRTARSWYGGGGWMEGKCFVESCPVGV